MIPGSMLGKTVSAFGGIENRGDLVTLQTDDLFFMQLRGGDFGGVVDFNESFVKKVLAHGAHSGELASLCALIAGQPLVMKFVIGKITQKNLKVGIRDLLQIFQRDILNCLETAVFPIG